MLFEETISAGHRVAAVHAYRLAGPLACKSELAPGRNVALTTTVSFGEDRVDLLERQTFDGIVFVDPNGDSVNCDFNFCGLISVLLLKAVRLSRLHLARHRPQLGSAGDQGWRCGSGPFTFYLDPDARIELAESFAPHSHHVIERVGTHARNPPAHTADFLIGSDLGINPSGLTES